MIVVTKVNYCHDESDALKLLAGPKCPLYIDMLYYYIINILYHDLLFVTTYCTMTFLTTDFSMNFLMTYYTVTFLMTYFTIHH